MAWAFSKLLRSRTGLLTAEMQRLPIVGVDRADKAVVHFAEAGTEAIGRPVRARGDAAAGREGVAGVPQRPIGYLVRTAGGIGPRRKPPAPRSGRTGGTALRRPGARWDVNTTCV